MQVRRCKVLYLEPREDVGFDLDALLAGGTGLQRERRWVALAPHLGHEIDVENASFFRMDDINLGYTFNKIGNWKGSMRVAFGVQNVFVITDYSGVDPEIPGVNGIDGSIWPRPRTYSLRLNVNF